MNRLRLRWIATSALAAVVMGAGCASKARWVDCDRKLEPINTVVTAAKPRPAARRAP